MAQSRSETHAPPFIDETPAGDALRCCFYEFHYAPVSGVDVMIIFDAKVNETTDKKGKSHASFPRKENLAAIKAAKIPKKNVIYREARKN